VFLRMDGDPMDGIFSSDTGDAGTYMVNTSFRPALPTPVVAELPIEQTHAQLEDLAMRVTDLETKFDSAQQDPEARTVELLQEVGLLNEALEASQEEAKQAQEEAETLRAELNASQAENVVAQDLVGVLKTQYEAQKKIVDTQADAAADAEKSVQAYKIMTSQLIENVGQLKARNRMYEYILVIGTVVIVFLIFYQMHLLDKRNPAEINASAPT
ncbi:MAG: hypothetical protein G01um101470_736, partial [Parcubacteria group bacterium Gr01-1014_70]